MNLPEALSQIAERIGGETNFTLALLTMALVLSRVLPVIVLSPFLGGDLIPTEVKLGVGLALGLILFPAVSGAIGNVPLSALPFILLLLKELFIGLALATVVGSVFHAANVAGGVVDMMAGTNMAQVMVPQIQQQVTLFSSLKMQLAIVLFLTLNGHHMVITALGDSFLSIPVDQFPAFSSGMWAFFDLIIRVFADMMRIALSLAAPAFLAAFLADFGLGMINRVAPQMQVYFIAMQIKPLVTALVLLLTLHVVIDRLNLEFEATLRWLQQALRLLG